jgi:hypothetical protein
VCRVVPLRRVVPPGRVGSVVRVCSVRGAGRRLFLRPLIPARLMARAGVRYPAAVVPASAMAGVIAVSGGATVTGAAGGGSGVVAGVVVVAVVLLHRGVPGVRYGRAEHPGLYTPLGYP